MMNATTTPPDYGTVLTTTLSRLVHQLEEAVDDGTWAVSEAAALHGWVRAELVPWASSVASTLDPRTRRELQPLFAELAALDAQLLGTAGSAAAAMARQLEVVADRLVATTHPRARIVSSAVPRQRDNASSDLPTSPHGSGSRPGRD